MLEAVVIRERTPVINVQSNLISAIPLFDNAARHEARTSGTPPPSPPPPSHVPIPTNPLPLAPVGEVGGRPALPRSARVRSC